MIHIAFNLDNNYVAHCATVIASIIDNNTNYCSISFHLISADLSSQNKNQLKDWIKSKGNSYQIFFYDINKTIFEDFPLGQTYLNITCYYRLLIPTLLQGISKAIYLDCDTIVLNSLEGLWNTTLEAKAWAGVRDRINDYIRVYNRLDFPLEYGYFNDGVMLLNLDEMRKVDIIAISKDLAKNIPLALKNHEQDILNKIFYKSKQPLDFKYNLLEYYLYTEEWLYLDRKYYPEIIEACKNPVIVHFCMPQKPWHIECINPYKELYYKYRKMTPWPELKLTHKKEKLSKKQKLKLALEKLGLYKVERKSTLRKDINNIEESNNVLF